MKYLWTEQGFEFNRVGAHRGWWGGVGLNDWHMVNRLAYIYVFVHQFRTFEGDKRLLKYHESLIKES